MGDFKEFEVVFAEIMAKISKNPTGKSWQYSKILQDVGVQQL